MNLTGVWWGLGVVMVFVVVAVCLVPGQELPKAFDMNDKVSHLAGHGLLAIYFAGLIPRRRWWLVFLFLLLLGIGIEFAQEAMHLGREGDARDVAANSTGALLGLVLARLGLERWPDIAARLLGQRRAAP